MLLPLLLQLGAVTDTVDVPLRRPAGRPSFADEFSGAALDTAKWRYETERNREGWYNNERQYYSADRPENVRTEGGMLVIEARRDGAALATRPDHGGQAYSSGRLTSRAGWTYGFYEIRAKLPCGRGLWPAIWMLPQNPKPQVSKPWPDGGEIDIMEQVGWRPHVVHATLHTGLYNHMRGTQRGAERPLATDCTAFHRYQMHWTPGAITIGIDGRGFLRVANDKPGGAGAWPFDTPFRLLLNLAVGGDWGGAKWIDDTVFPARLTIDYVRVWNAPKR